MSDTGARRVGVGGVRRTSVLKWGAAGSGDGGHWLHPACRGVSAYVGELFTAGYLRALNLIGIEHDNFNMVLCLQSVASLRIRGH